MNIGTLDPMTVAGAVAALAIIATFLSMRFLKRHGMLIAVVFSAAAGGAGTLAVEQAIYHRGSIPIPLTTNPLSSGTERPDPTRPPVPPTPEERPL